MSYANVAELVGLMAGFYAPRPQDVQVAAIHLGDDRFVFAILAGVTNNVSLHGNHEAMKVITKAAQVLAKKEGITVEEVCLRSMPDVKEMVKIKPKEPVPVELMVMEQVPKEVPLPKPPKQPEPQTEPKKQKPQIEPAIDLFLVGEKGVGLTGNEKLLPEAKAIIDVAGMAKVKDPFSVVMKACADVHGIPVADILSVRKPQNIVDARQMAMYICTYWQLGVLMEIGDKFGRDHGTIIHARNVVAGRVATSGSKYHVKLLNCLREIVILAQAEKQTA